VTLVHIPLPKSWPRRVKSAMLAVVSLANNALTRARATASASRDSSRRHQADVARLEQEIALLQEEIRIKDARLAQIPPHRRPQYEPVERLAILELRAARGWSLAQTARMFLVTAETIAAWVRCIDDEGPDPLLKLHEPVNRFPDFVRHVVQRLRVLCPRLGKAKIAQLLARAGLHLAATTVARLTARPPTSPAEDASETATRIVTAKRPKDMVQFNFLEWLNFGRLLVRLRQDFRRLAWTPIRWNSKRR